MNFNERERERERGRERERERDPKEKNRMNFKFCSLRKIRQNIEHCCLLNNVLSSMQF